MTVYRKLTIDEVLPDLQATSWACCSRPHGAQGLSFQAPNHHVDVSQGQRKLLRGASLGCNSAKHGRRFPKHRQIFRLKTAPTLPKPFRLGHSLLSSLSRLPCSLQCWPFLFLSPLRVHSWPCRGGIGRPRLAACFRSWPHTPWSSQGWAAAIRLWRCP